MLVLCFLFLLGSLGVRAQEMFGVTVGSYEVYTIYNTASSSQPVVHASTYPPTPTTAVGRVYMLQTTTLPLLGGTPVPLVEHVVGRTVSYHQVVVGPKGCDNADPNQAIENSNCAYSTAEAHANYELTQSTWWMRYGSPECQAAGGDYMSCLGPFIPAIDGHDYLAEPLPSQLSLHDRIFDRGKYIIGGGGPYGNVKTTTEIQINTGYFLVSNTSCNTSDLGLNFAGSYSTQGGTDPYASMLNDVIWSFQKADQQYPQLRVLIVRNGNGYFELQLADAAGTGIYNKFYNVYWRSTLHLTTDTVTEELVAALAAQPFQSFYSTSVPGRTCIANLTLWAIDPPYTLIPPQIPTLVNYANSESFRPRFHTNRWCNYHVGALSRANLLKYPYCAEGQKCGGYTVFESETFPHLRMKIPSDIGYSSYDMDPARVYPRPTFTGFGLGTTGESGATYNTREPGQGLNYSPFVNPSAILSATSPDVRQQDARRMGGYTATRSADAIAVPENFVPCPPEFLFYDDLCWRKFDVEATPQVVTTIDKFITVCQTDAAILRVLGSERITLAQPVVSVDVNFQLWALSHFVLRNPQSTPYVMPTSSGVCDCVEAKQTSASNWGSTIYSCPCNGIPFCTIPAYIVPSKGTFEEIPRQTLNILKDGQEGTDVRGQKAMCRCFPFWYGSACHIPTGLIPADLSSDHLDPTIATFYTRCFLGDRGISLPGKYGMCTCTASFGPPAISNATGLYHPDWANFPCFCPAWGHDTLAQNASFVVDGTTYSNTAPGGLLVCGGSTRGTCSTNAGLGGQCTCRDGFHGNACSCQLPLPLPSGYVVNPPGVNQRVCSGRGTCCPGGAGCGHQPNNCVCEAGWTGDACTCSAPYDWLQVWKTNPQPTTGGVLVTFPSIALPVEMVFVTGCTVTAVATSTSACQNNGAGWWQCNPAVFASTITVSTTDVWTKCTIKAYRDTDIMPCGFPSQTNPTAARLFDSPNFAKDAYPSSLAFGPFGCTATECLCGPGFGGARCGAGVSRWSATQILFCGASTLPARGSILYPDPGGMPGMTANRASCQCASLATTDVSGVLGIAPPVFNGTACECLSYLNPDSGTREICGGHGTCIHPTFPYGTCDRDLDAADTDPLRTPLVPVLRSGLYCNSFADRIVDEKVWGGTVCGPVAGILPGWQSLGFAYGAYWNTHPALDYSQPNWGSDHFSFISALTNYERCFDMVTGNDLVDILASDSSLQDFLSDVAYLGNFSYAVMHNLTWPTNQRWVAAKLAYVQRVGGITCTTPDYDYLRAFHAAKLSPFRCSRDAECQLRWDGTSRCVLDEVPHIPWRNGAQAPEVAFGDEGGCDCPPTFQGSGFRDPLTFCSVCTAGYGPYSVADLTPTVIFQSQLADVAQLPGPLIVDLSPMTGGNPIDTMREYFYCRLPFSTTASGNLVCGGRGALRNDTTSTTISLQAIGNLVPTCTALMVGTVTLTLIPPRDLDVLVYVNANMSVVVAGQVWLNGVPWVPVSCTTTGPFFSCAGSVGPQITCVRDGIQSHPTAFLDWIGLRPTFANVPPWIARWG